MRSEYINAFIEPAIQAIEKTLKINASIGRIKRGKELNFDHSISVSIGIFGDLSGAFVMSISKSAAKKIVANMINSDDVSDLNEYAKSALSELANIIAGNASGKLHEMGINGDIAPPNTFSGSNVELSIPSTGKSLMIPIETKLGKINMSLYLKDERIA